MEATRIERILQSVKRRPGVNVGHEMLKDMINDCIEEVRDYINYKDGEEVPASLDGTIKELVFEKLNKDGVQGIQSESLPSGSSTTYLQDISVQHKQRLRKYRRFRR